MQHCFIVNPVAGQAGSKKEEKLAIALAMDKLGLPWEIYVSRGVGDATNFVNQYCRHHQDEVRFYACGGDGTLNEVVNGAAGFEHVSVASLPWGTGNDFIKNFSNQKAFWDIGRQALAPASKIDLLKVNQRFCINICNVGFDAQVALHMAKFKQMPFVHGSSAYGLSVLYCFFKKTAYAFTIELEDGQYIDDKFLLAVMANGRFYGGAYEGAPRAKVDDGFLDLILVKKLSRRRIPGLINIYKEGRHLESPLLADVITYKRLRSLTIRSSVALPISLDGELISATELKVEVVPQIMNFVQPVKERMLSLTMGKDE
ncbi:MAG: diacylglycerol kinase family protein [Clostridiales bacterium]